MLKLQSRNIYHKTETFHYFGPFSYFVSKNKVQLHNTCKYKNNICISVCSRVTLHLLSKKIHTLSIFTFRVLIDTLFNGLYFWECQFVTIFLLWWL